MNRAFKKYFLLLCILLINGFNYSYAHSNPNYAASINSECKLVDGLPTKVCADSFEIEISKPLIAEAADSENEEEEVNDVPLSSNKNLVFGGFKVADHYALMLEHFSCKIENEFSYFKPHTFAAPCKRHIRFQVFRI